MELVDQNYDQKHYTCIVFCCNDENVHFHKQIRDKFGRQVEAFFVIFVSIQFHMLFYCTHSLPNIMALGVVNMAYGYWFRGSFYAALNCLIFATVIFRCNILLLLGPLGLELLLIKSISFWKAFRYCVGAALFSIGLTVLVDSFIWRKPLWPEFEVFWFNSILNRSSDWGRLHEEGNPAQARGKLWVDVDTFSAMNGVSRFCENGFPWRYSKEEDIPLDEYRHRKFTYLLNENRDIRGFKCLFTVNGFSHLQLQTGFPQVSLVSFTFSRWEISMQPNGCAQVENAINLLQRQPNLLRSLFNESLH
ncbi:dol-P-Man:Man(7)GlcNAc(2)-PP-Dol alpha-1,6-mannosyltransferase-like [Apium graveolens]|uniref:dol-P-Man:Man(7)GlcNAc(2)-PP-Dol alpha-1,6-mannosyltransferase-like n=1 Tax=Apium graveolens TaxID=4045 RepID=UPI003D7A68FC